MRLHRQHGCDGGTVNGVASIAFKLRASLMRRAVFNPFEFTTTIRIEVRMPAKQMREMATPPLTLADAVEAKIQHCFPIRCASRTPLGASFGQIRNINASNVVRLSTCRQVNGATAVAARILGAPGDGCAAGALRLSCLKICACSKFPPASYQRRAALRWRAAAEIHSHRSQYR